MGAVHVEAPGGGWHARSDCTTTTGPAPDCEDCALLTLTRWSRFLIGLCAFLVLTACQASRDRSTPSPVSSGSIVVDEGTSMAIALSPDGRTLAIDLQGSIWTLPVDGGDARRVTDEFYDARQPAWSPDGRTIAFQGFRNGDWDIWAISPDGSNARTLTDGPFDDREPHFSPDGRYLAFSSDRNGNYDVWTLDLQSGELKAITTSPADEFFPSWSPDGREIAFASNRQQASGIYAATLDGRERLLARAEGNLGTPSWSPDGNHVAFSTIVGGESRLIVDGETVSTNEDVFPFRAQWTSPNEFLYTADGQIKRRTLGTATPSRVAFTAALPVERPAFTRKRRDFDSTAPRPVRGIVRPVVSPDGKRVAFAALGDIWIMTIGSEPERVTNDHFLDSDPAWSPDGRMLAFTSDRAGNVDVWVRDLERGTDRRLTTAGTSDMLPTWSPDGRRIAFVAIDALFTGEIQIVDVQSGTVTKAHDSVFGPSEPQWSADGRRLLFARLKRYSSRFREGINEFVSVPVAGGGREVAWSPLPHRGSDVRAGGGPVWSPDGKRVAFVMEGALTVVDVAPDGSPTGKPRRVTNEIAHSPSWTGDSRGLVYLSNERLRRVSADGGTPEDIPFGLHYEPANPSGTLVVRVGRLVDGVSATPRTDVDIVVEGHRIVAIEPQRERPGATVVDGSDLTAIPGLIEMHGHLVKEYGEAMGRVLLAYGVTTIRNPAAMTPYMSLEDREAVEAGVRVGPRVFASGYQMDGSRVYYPLGLSISSAEQLEWELERQARLDLDFIKTYVRLPDLFQKRTIEFGHSHGMPVTSHELYPAVGVGADGTEHTSGTSRRGYSPKISGLQRAYGDVVALIGKTQAEFTPTASLGGGFRQLAESDPGMLSDPRYQTLFPEWIVKAAAGGRGGRGGGFGEPRGAKMALDVLNAGGKVLAGTDAPIGPYGLALQAELAVLVAGGMTPLQALQTATVHAAAALNASDDLGAIAPGRLADIVLVEGDPLADIRNARQVRMVIKNGVVYRLEELLRQPSATH
jgi:Tol biopolymer transport system component